MPDYITQALIESTMSELKEYPFLLCKEDVRKIMEVDKRTVIDMWPHMATVGGERSRVPKVVFIDYLIRKGRECGLEL